MTSRHIKNLYKEKKTVEFIRLPKIHQKCKQVCIGFVTLFVRHTLSFLKKQQHVGRRRKTRNNKCYKSDSVKTQVNFVKLVTPFKGMLKD